MAMTQSLDIRALSEQQASLEERLRSVPNYWRITIESNEPFPSVRHIPVGPMCHEAAAALAAKEQP